MVTLVGVALKANPPQILVLIGVTPATGLMVTVYVNVVPAPQLTLVGVTIYVAVCAVLVGLVKLPVNIDAPLTVNPPVNPPVTLGADQL